MKKRLWLVVMALVIAMMMTACGSKEVEDNENDVVQEETASERPQRDKEEVVETEEVDEGVEEDIEEELILGYYPGIYSEEGYDSEYVGFRYVTPEGCTLSSAEEIGRVIEMGQDMMSEDLTEIQKEYMNETLITEMLVMAPDGVTNLSVALQKLIPSSITEDEFTEAIQTQLAGSISTMDIVVSDTVEEVDIAGVTYKKLTMESTYEGITMNQEFYYRKIDDRMVMFTMTYLGGSEDQRDLILSGFQAY